MNPDKSNAGRGNAWRIAGWGVAALILLLPFVANAPWTLSDYVFMGVLLLGVGIPLEFAVRKSGNWSYRGGVAVAVVAAFLHVWINGAVGVIGSEDNPGNLLYLGVVLVAILGAVAARGRAPGMAWAMAAAAVAEVLVPPLAFAAVADPASDVLRPEVFVLTGFFALLWLAAAVLFRNAAREEARPIQAD